MKYLPLMSVTLNSLFISLQLLSNFSIQPAQASSIFNPNPWNFQSQQWNSQTHQSSSTPALLEPPIATSSLVAQNAESGKETKDSLEDFDTVTKNTKKLTGLFTLYRNEKKGEIYLEIKPEQLNRNYLCIVTLSSGLGEAGLFQGMPAGEMLFQWRRVQDRVQFTVPNVNFRAHPSDPVQRSLNRSFSDSVLYSLKIKSIHPQRKTLLIDLSQLLLSPTDLPGLSAVLPQILQAPYSIDPDKSSFGEVQGFPLNVEIESVYGFNGGGTGGLLPQITSVPDSRSFSLSVHYSLSELPVANGYRPRLADERVGYFVTAYQDFSDDSRREPFIRYIQRWNLEKQDPNAALSPPKKPIVFWIENTVPTEYREAIRQGILAWNKAFEQAGFLNAIEARQMPDNVDWNPADVRYNVIRWSASFDSGFLGLGPSQVNPFTGEILSADILIDASVVRLFKSEFRNKLAGQNSSQTQGLVNPCTQSLRNLYLRGVELPEEDQTALSGSSLNWRLPDQTASELCYGALGSRQFATGAIATMLLQNLPPESAEMDKFVQQYLTLVIVHEVGHTLGLRHNFHGSTYLNPDELNNPEITQTRGMVASVMDYIPANLAPPGVKQGDYFPTIVGPYDQWAIEYGYTDIPASTPTGELPKLRQIAQRSNHEPELSYGTDEDAMANLDPEVNWFDLSRNTLQYSRSQLDNAKVMWTRLNQQVPAGVESYSEMREMFDSVLMYYFQQAMNLTLYVGGKSFNRGYPGELDERLPFEPISGKQQREALKTLNQYVFADGAFQFSPQLLNRLAPSRWWHWGMFPEMFRLDYPISDRIFYLQRVVLRSLLSPARLVRMQDMELKAEPDKDIIRMPELFQILQDDLWTEIQPKNGTTEISSIRRSLQREHIEILMGMVLRKTRVPDDARSLAWYSLRQLRDQINTKLRRDGRELDTYSQAHLQQTRDRIIKTLDASLQSN